MDAKIANLTKITNLIYRKQKWVEVIAIFLFFTLIAFRFDSRGVKLLSSDYPSITIAIALTISLIAVLWVRIERHKNQALINDLRDKKSEKSLKLESKFLELSLRQKEVFDLITIGKSNKEIMAALNIELSTLKTHINQIYKALGIKSRKEAQLFDNEVDN